jgi:hypothetical protein
MAGEIEAENSRPKGTGRYPRFDSLFQVPARPRYIAWYYMLHHNSDPQLMEPRLLPANDERIISHAVDISRLLTGFRNPVHLVIAVEV